MRAMTIERGVLVVLAIAVAVLVYFHFADTPEVKYRTSTIYTPSSSGATFRERELQAEQQRIDRRLDCLSRQAQETRDSLYQRWC